MGKLLKITCHPMLFLFIAIAFFAGGCSYPKSPAPTVTIFPGGDFSIKVDSMPGATQVRVSTFDANSNPLDSVILAPNGQYDYKSNKSSAMWPVRVKISYLKNQQVLAENEVKVDGGPGGHGGGPIVAIDVIMSRNPTVSQCPNVNLLVKDSGLVIVPWKSGDWFKILVTHANSTVDTVGVTIDTFPAVKEHWITHIYRDDNYPCMAYPPYDDSNNKRMKLGTPGNEFYISATYDSTNANHHKLSIENTSKTLLIEVYKKN